MNSKFSFSIIAILLIIIVYLLGGYFPPNTFLNTFTKTPATPTSIPTVIPFVRTYISPTRKPDPVIKEKVIITNQQVVIPTAVPKVPVYLSTSNRTYYCKPEGVDAIKSADTVHSKIVSDWKSCLGVNAMRYAVCTNKCAFYDPSEECKNTCTRLYRGEQLCPTPNVDSLQSLLNQYCK